MSHYSALARLGLPIIIGQLGTIVLGFADTMMIGHHSTEELAAASFVNNMFMLVLIFALGFSYAITPMVSGMYAQERDDEVGKVVKNGILANVILSLLLIATLFILYANIGNLGQPEELLPLMRPYLVINIVSLPFVMSFNVLKQFADGITDTRTPMWILVGGNLMNIIGNWILIYGKCGLPELGLLGAGLATLISRIVMFATFAYLFFYRRSYQPYSNGFRESSVSSRCIRKIYSLGMPLALQMGMETAAFALCSVMVGWLGVTALAAHQIMLTVSQLFYMIYYGMAAAVAIRVSYFQGQKDVKALRQTTYAGMHLILLIAVCVSIPVFLLRNQIGGWFNDDAEVQSLISILIIPLIVYQFGDCLQCTFANALRGISYVKPLMFTAFFAYFMLCLPVSYIFGFVCDWGLVGIWFSYSVGLTSAGVLYYYFFHKGLRQSI